MKILLTTAFAFEQLDFFLPTQYTTDIHTFTKHLGDNLNGPWHVAVSIIVIKEQSVHSKRSRANISILQVGKLSLGQRKPVLDIW